MNPLPKTSRAGDNDDTGDQVAEGDGELDADGKLTINVATTVSEHKADYLYRVEARVTDLGKREITGKGWVVATYGSFVLNATPDRYFYAPGSAATVTVEARDYDNKPVATAFHIKLARYNSYDRQFGEMKAETGGSVGANGQGTVSLNIPAEGGSYRIEATARTPEGRDVQALRLLLGLRRRLPPLPKRPQGNPNRSRQENLPRRRYGQAPAGHRPAQHPALGQRGGPRPAPVQARPFPAIHRRVRRPRYHRG